MKLLLRLMRIKQIMKPLGSNIGVKKWALTGRVGSPHGEEGRPSVGRNGGGGNGGLKCLDCWSWKDEDWNEMEERERV